MSAYLYQPAPSSQIISMKKYDYSFITNQFIRDMNPSRKERWTVIKYAIKKILNGHYHERIIL